MGTVEALTPLLSTIPIRARDTVVIAAPLFHAWGLVHLGVGLGLSSTAVVRPHFDAEERPHFDAEETLALDDWFQGVDGSVVVGEE